MTVLHQRIPNLLTHSLTHFPAHPTIHRSHPPGLLLPPDGSYQRPVLVLVTSCSGSSVPGQAVLSWRELRTLVHELGHAMHNLVSRTRFQHLWGTR